ncbi:MAG: amidohydrolase family protein [Chitinophagaceae bacterium]
MKYLLCLGSLLLSSFMKLQAQSEDTLDKKFIISHVNIIDVTNGTVKKDMDVTIIGNRISYVRKSIAARTSKKAATIDATNKFLIPGLWDMHTHVLNHWDRHSLLFVANGITGVRDMASGIPLHKSLIIKNQVYQGIQAGPQFITPGPPLDGEVSLYPHEALFITSKERAIHVADSLKKAGADFLKVINYIPRNAFFALLKRAKEIGMSVVGHTPFSVTPAQASNAGFRSIEHLMLVRETVCTKTDEVLQLSREASRARLKNDWLTVNALQTKSLKLMLETLSENECIELGKLFVANDTWLTPTMRSILTKLLPKDSILNNPNWRYMPKDILASWRTSLNDTTMRGIANDLQYEQMRIKVTSLLHKAGAHFLAGTDANEKGLDNVPGFSLHEELEIFLSAGFTPLEALQTATINPAVFLKATDSLGTVGVGKIASLVLLDANPLENIRNTKKIYAVVLNGRYLDRKALDDLLQEAEKRAGTMQRETND